MSYFGEREGEESEKKENEKNVGIDSIHYSSKKGKGGRRDVVVEGVTETGGKILNAMEEVELGGQRWGYLGEKTWVYMGE